MSRQKFQGFTLVEILIVVVIMAVLAAVVVPQFAGSTDDAKRSTAEFNLGSVRSIHSNVPSAPRRNQATLPVRCHDDRGAHERNKHCWCRHHRWPTGSVPGQHARESLYGNSNGQGGSSARNGTSCSECHARQRGRLDLRFIDRQHLARLEHAR